jgi:hypothetical protein
MQVGHDDSDAATPGPPGTLNLNRGFKFKNLKVHELFWAPGPTRTCGAGAESDTGHSRLDDKEATIGSAMIIR